MGCWAAPSLLFVLSLLGLYIFFAHLRNPGSRLTGEGFADNPCRADGIFISELRALETIDLMTARRAYLPYDFLAHVSRRMMNEIGGIARVVYDTSGKPPGIINGIFHGIYCL
jgi:hypothetical protein